MIDKQEIWLADLTYTQQSMASDVVPAAIGGLAEFIEANTEFYARIFKLPQDLLQALEIEQPRILGFSNYIWNANLSLEIAKKVRKKFLDITIIVGGPNITSENEELEKFLFKHQDYLDYAVLKEGEIGLLNLINFLLKGHTKKNFNSNAEVKIDGFSFLNPQGKLQKGNLVRFMNLEELPSPYISGRLDKFLNGQFLPVIQTNRGCPFTCTFCTEGQHYWNKVRRKPLETIGNELRYIAKKMNEKEGTRRDLLIADSNFGMYEPDLEIAKEIGKIQDEFNFPTYINVATGKNRKERVLETARLVKGAMSLAGSVQSLDENVLINIRRDNIAPDALLSMALEAATIGTMTYSEVILALPGDTKEAHFETIRKLIDAGFTSVQAYQMMLLPATEMDKMETRTKYEFNSKFRLVPRCFGIFTFFGETFTAAEIEEIVISHKDITIDEYMECRVLALFVTVFYNAGLFLEFHRVLQMVGGSSFTWINRMMDDWRNSSLAPLVHNFIQDTNSELWNDLSALENEIKNPGFIQKAVDGEIGNNILFFYKANSLTLFIKDMFNFASATFISYLDELLPFQQNLLNLAKDMFNWRFAEIEGLFNLKETSKVTYTSDIDIAQLMDDLFHGRTLQLETLECNLIESREEILELDPGKKTDLKAYLDLFGNSEIGIARVLSRIYMRHYFRKPLLHKVYKEEKVDLSVIPSSQFGLRED